MNLNLLKSALLAVFGLGSGAIIAAGIFAFITVLGVIPRLAQKTRTESAVKIYESVILGGGLFGCLASFYNIQLAAGGIITVLLSFANGVFFGSIAVALAETINVIPIMTRRAHIQEGLFFFVLALALGKLTGSLLYFIIPGFHKSF